MAEGECDHNGKMGEFWGVAELFCDGGYMNL